MKKHENGSLESIKFDARRKDFYDYTEYLSSQNIPVLEWMEHFTAYVGHMSLHRVLTLFELYKMTSNVAGHIAEIGVYKGAGSLLFSKLVEIYESESLTLVHGFDWFKGSGEAGENDSELVSEHGYQSDKEHLEQLIKLQKLDHILKIHDLDVRAELDSFFSQHKHLQFKLVFMDAGRYDVMKAAIPAFWDRLIPGGIMVLDQFSHELGPGETMAVREILPNNPIRTIPNSWMPNAYIVKE